MDIKGQGPITVFVVEVVVQLSVSLLAVIFFAELINHWTIVSRVNDNLSMLLEFVEEDSLLGGRLS